ncbi:type ISP restriction/modification enzyme [Erythrobacter sanguineus]|uniref:site-specific DNA-methyltransferase (adenine-specific) n=1 Tax=Erythrobacter sanguineus TaxID=198312 RepID=A0A1M7S9Q0_9SPHN|nr:type ISP restriction/modification enzyme [Erythrobacter sanguineus]SHN55148.1 N-6 DNA Methylase [Erythrobacter sanguineus]
MTQANTIEKAVGEFGASASAKLAGGDGQPEDQLRAPLEALFAQIAAILNPAVKNLVMTGETSLAELRTRPDYAVKVNNALVGFIEVKAPGKGADPRKWKTGHDKEQWDKLKALPNLLYTDGDSFSLWRDGALVGQIVHLDGGVEHAGAKLTAPQVFLPLLNDFLTWKPIAPKGANELARVSARLCRFLRDEVLEQLNASEKNAKLTDLKDDWKALLFPDADDDKFADGYAQAVTFGLLMAKSKDMSLEGGLDHVAKELGKANTLIGTALRLLTEQDLNLGPALDTLTRVLDEVSWAKVSKGDPEAWLYFYENFLEVYDNRLRKLTGSYYTPPEVVRTMVRLCDEALKSQRFGIADGLAGKDVHIVDPATGSGTFLLGTIERIKATIEANHGGPGAVAPMMEDVAGRLIGFELQFGAFAVAQLRLLAEMLEIGADATPRLFVTDTLGDPYADIESGQGIYREISKSRTEANKVKRSEPITVVIGNPPYKEKAKGKGAWIESGNKNKGAPLNDWQPPKAWKIGTHAKHLRNLYIYFWRWAAWKVFEQGAGGRDKQPPVGEKLAGMVCYITVSGFLNGPGFQKMRADLRSQCDDIWVIDCSPEGHQPEVATRIFQGVQHPVCIVLASRSRTPGEGAARVRYRALAKGRREEKFAELKTVTLGDKGWSDCPSDARAPFLPELREGWGAFAPLDSVIDDCGSGVMPGRTWIIAPDEVSLKQRWKRLIDESKAEKRAMLFQPHMRNGKPGDRHIGKSGKALWWPQRELLTSVEDAPKQVDHDVEKLRVLARRALAGEAPIRYGFRSFDRQFILPDARVINQPNPGLWENHSDKQIYFSALMAHSPKSGPAISTTALIPDLHQYKGSFGGRVFALWKNADATESNVSPAVVALLAKAFGAPVDSVDVFAYVAALLAHPAYTSSFADDLIRPGLRVPLTADAALFAEAAKLGREVVRLHTFGERFATEDPPQPPRVANNGPVIPKDGAIPSTPEGFPDTLDYDAAKRRLLVGTGFIDNVPPAVWAYEVSGKQVLRQWFSYRRKDRERPLIGDKRPPSPLGDIQPDRWQPEYTSELINVLNVLALLVELEPKQADLLKRICDGPLIPASKL